MVDKQTAILPKAFLKNFLSNSPNSLSAEKVMVLIIVYSVVIRKQNWMIKISNFMVFLKSTLKSNGTCDGRERVADQ